MKLKPDIALSENGFIFNPSTGDSYSINPIGVKLLDMMKAGKSETDIRTYVLDHYDVSEPQWEEDYYDFISYLKQLNILEDA